MTRRIVQIATLPGREILALCDDGTVQRGAFSGSGTSDRFQWWPSLSLPPVPQDELAVDPIAELEAMGGRITVVYDSVTDAYRLWWFLDAATQEDISGVVGGVSVSDLRAAAARLLDRIRGAK